MQTILQRISKHKTSNIGRLTQLVECFRHMEEVGSSSLLSPTTKKGTPQAHPFSWWAFKRRVRGNLLPSSVCLAKQILAVNDKT